MDFQKPYPTTLTEKELDESFLAYHEEFTDFLLLKALPEVKDMLNRLNKALPCRQYQSAISDIESLEENLTDLVANGPKEPWKEISLEESEIQDEFEFEQPDLEFAEETGEDPHADIEGAPLFT